MDINFLAHLTLAAPTDASRVGNLLGDFVRGTPESLRGRWPDEVLEGILMHRHLDRFTDNHPAFLEARALLSLQRQRFAGIIVDIIFDHFLAQSWDRHHKTSLPQFVEEMYALLERREDWLEPRLRAVLPRMREENWLESYTTIEGLELTFGRVASRSPRFGPIAGAADDLGSEYRSFARCFEKFLPDAQEESDRLKQERLLPW